jgi:hypothetical protein
MNGASKVAAAATIVRSGLVRTRGLAPQRQAPSLFLLPGLSARAWWSRAELGAWVRELEAGTETLLAEYDALCAARAQAARAAQPAGAAARARSDYELAQGEQALHEGAWDWQSFIMKGRWQSRMEQSCPRSAALLRRVPGLMTGLPLSYAFFSTLGPGATIKPHFGPSNLRVRVHLPLRVPSGDCGIRVGGETRRWRKGECLLFDDAYEHETWNLDASEPRTVLLLDVWHPEVQIGERDALVAMFDAVDHKGQKLV